MDRRRIAWRRIGGRRVAGGAALVAMLAGCGEMRLSLAEADDGRGLCAPVPQARNEAAANAYQQAIQRDECVHRWSYAFAAAPDSAEAVAEAVVGACRAEIDRSANLLGGGDSEAERWYVGEMEKAARERALYRIIQARVGNCS